jgi:GT2 family glycosyltransferase
LNTPSTIDNPLDMSVIIPFKDKSTMTIACLDSFFKYGPAVKEIFLISNNSSDEELDVVKEYANRHPNISLGLYDKPFNYQKMMNWGANKTTANTLMFLNNDTELREKSQGLIERMHSKAQEKKIGIVGCLLLFGDEQTIQHAGVFLVPEGQADHLYVRSRYNTARTQAGTKEFPYDVDESRPLSAVTGAVHVVTRAKFDEVSGLDEDFIICGGDVDLCLRLNQKGHQTWYESGGYILHKESQSRRFIPIAYNDFYMSYKSYIKGFDPEVGDPFLPEVTKTIKIHGV